MSQLDAMGCIGMGSGQQELNLFAYYEQKKINNRKADKLRRLSAISHINSYFFYFVLHAMYARI